MFKRKGRRGDLGVLVIKFSKLVILWFHLITDKYWIYYLPTTRATFFCFGFGFLLKTMDIGLTKPQADWLLHLWSSSSSLAILPTYYQNVSQGI